MSDVIQTIPTLKTIQAMRQEILQAAAHYRVSNVRIFGSVVRGEATANSDIDLLVDLPQQFSLVQLSGLVRTLREITGWRVEVVSAAHLREELRETILREAILL